MSRNIPFAKKASLSAAIDGVLGRLANPSSAVAINGTFGERGVVFSKPAQPDRRNGAKVEFRWVGGGSATNTKPLDLSRDHAVALTKFLIKEYGLTVSSETICETHVTVS